jgi:hypothetical protein
MRVSYTLVMASALLLAGCAREQHNAQYDESISPAYSAGRMTEYDNDHNTAVSSPVVPSATVAAGKSPAQSDNAIVASVRELLRRNAEVAPIVPNIQISANNGAIILSGTVQSAEQKRQIEAIAQQATGVVAVNNQLDIISTPQQTGMENQVSNPLLNPTSTGTNNPPVLYQNAAGGAENSNTNALTPSSTSTVSNSPPRLYRDAGSSAENSNSNALLETSRPNGAGRIYQEQNGQPQTTNSDQSTSDSPMH